MSIKVNVVSIEGIERESSYYGNLIVTLNGLNLSELIEEVGEDQMFEAIGLEDYVDWAEKKGHSDDILDRLSPDLMIAYLKRHKHMDDE